MCVCAFVIVLGRYSRIPLLLARSSKHMQALGSDYLPPLMLIVPTAFGGRKNGWSSNVRYFRDWRKTRSMPFFQWFFLTICVPSAQRRSFDSHMFAGAHACRCRRRIARASHAQHEINETHHMAETLIDECCIVLLYTSTASQRRNRLDLARHALLGFLRVKCVSTWKSENKEDTIRSSILWAIIP